MKQQTQVSFIGSGIIYINGRDIGNCSAANITYDVDTQNLPNYRGGGGNLETLERISAVNLEIGLTSLNADNLALLNSGTVSNIASTTVTDEEHTVSELDRLVRVEHMIDTTETVTVKDELDEPIPAADPVTGNINWRVVPAGIIVPDTSSISVDDDIKVSYSVPAGYLLQALLAFGIEGQVTIDGLNDINGKPHVIDCWRWKPSPAGLNAITTEFADAAVSGQLLSDETKPMGTSRFFRTMMKG